MKSKNIPLLQYYIIPSGTISNFWEMLVRRFYFIPIVILFVFNQGIFAQTKTNLEVFYILVDSSVSEFISHIPPSEDSVKLELNLGESYSIFNNKIISLIYSSGKIISEEKKIPDINFIIDNANVEYGEIFRDGFFGDYLIPRILSLKGNYLVKGNSAVFNEFNLFFSDTIKYDDIKYVENQSFAFTRGSVPSEPFFSGLLEPIVAIGTAAVAVILFFTIRSK